MIYIDFSIQTSPANMDTFLSDIQHVSSSLGQFLQELFRHPHKGSKDNDPARSQRHTQMVSQFLQGRTGIKTLTTNGSRRLFPEPDGIGFEKCFA